MPNKDFPEFMPKNLVADSTEEEDFDSSANIFLLQPLEANRELPAAVYMGFLC